ncbi:MAG TPA: TIR domain-containing protein, partial [Candidatus Didemnitutus sp.]|nr:TIR domain-containing protein [Candidatus Didemnitutus sp.]
MGETGNRAVFLSYASQDAEAAKKICEALRQAGVEVWFDQSELRGGDAWDQKIRRQIKECTLFMPVISANTNARPEGYFRLEWKLAVDRSHLMADDEPFLFPISIGDVKDATARVPDKFRDVQWTHLRLDETPAELAKRVGRLLKQGAGSPEEGASAEGAGKRAARPRSGGWNWWMIFPIIGAVMGLMFAAVPLWKAMNGATPKSPPPSPAVKAKADAPAVSEARQMTLKARNLFEGIDSTVDDYKTAEGLLQRASALDPTDGFIWAVYSRLNTGYSMRGFDFAPARQEEARSQMERAIRLAPDEAEAWLARGSYLRRTAGDRAEAEKALRKAIELAPQDKRAWFDLAWAVGAPGGSSDDEILALLDKSIDPERPGTAALAHYNQFLLLFGGRRFAEADAKIRQSVSELPSANFVTGLARSELTWKGDAAAAVAAIDVMTGEKKREARSVWFAAYAHLLARQPDAALADLRLLPGDFIEDSFFSGPKAYWEGRAQQQLGNADAARVAWETAL